MLRAYGYGLAAVGGVAIAHGICWSVIELTYGMLAVAVAGGWLIGHAVKQGLAAGSSGPAGEPAPAAEPASSALPAIAALLGVLAWLLGSYVAFAIVQLRVGQGDLFDRLMPGNFGPFLGSLLDPPALQLLVLAAYVVVAGLTARPGRPRPAQLQR